MATAGSKAEAPTEAEAKEACTNCKGKATHGARASRAELTHSWVQAGQGAKHDKAARS